MDHNSAPRDLFSVLYTLVSEDGAELAEYAIAMALFVVIGYVLYKVLGHAVQDSHAKTALGIKDANCR